MASAKLGAVTACRFGLIHRRVGPANQGCGVVFFLAQGNADTGRDMHGVSFKDHRLIQAVEQAFGKLLDGLG